LVGSSILSPGTNTTNDLHKKQPTELSPEVARARGNKARQLEALGGTLEVTARLDKTIAVISNIGELEKEV
jgi:hypothetical protein